MFRYFFSCVGACIKIYSVATGAVVKVLSRSPSMGGHTARVTRVLLNPRNPMQLYSASMDGTIKLWDYNDEILLKTYHIGAAIEQMVISLVHPDDAYIVVPRENETGKEKIIYRYSLGNDLPLTSQDRLRWITSIKECSSVAISENGQWLAMAGRYQCLLWTIKEGHERVGENELASYSFKELLTVIAFSPDNKYLALGDVSGKITLQYFSSPGQPLTPVTSVLHWHHLPVRALRFMGDGSYLMSGGEEAVLVIWQLETDHKQFLPRLGGTITSINISPNHKYYSVGLADNSIRLVNSISQTIEQVIQGLQYAQVESSQLPLSTGLVIEPRNHTLVLNGVPGSLQFYSTQGDCHVMDLEVAPSNRIARKEATDIIVEPNVEHVAFLARGEWMATVDMRDDKETTAELYLKFWQWDPNSQSYTLHTRVDYPHTQPITGLVFSPASRQGPMAITTSADGTFKVWVLASESRLAVNERAWTCRSVGVYRDKAPTTAAFAEDGSILAVAFGATITLWDPYENTMQGVLVQPLEETVTSLAFLADSPYLVATTKSHFYVWNLLTCSVWWSYKCSLAHLAVDSQSGRFAGVQSTSAGDRIMVFEAKSNVPLVLHTVQTGCTAIAWIPQETERDAKTSSLVVLDDRRDLNILSLLPHKTATPTATATPTTATETKSLAEETHDKTFFNDILGERLEVRAQDKEQEELRIKTAMQLREAMKQSRRETQRKEETARTGGLEAPSHVLPHVESVFESFMTHLMSLRVEDREIVEDVMEVDSEQGEEPSETHALTAIDSLHFIPSEDFSSFTAYFSASHSNGKSIHIHTYIHTLGVGWDKKEREKEKGGIFIDGYILNMKIIYVMFHLISAIVSRNVEESSSDNDDSEEEEDASKIEW
ncbi:quinon protein alcohol dehydrogenase-like superfamily [Spinellus fusiger]|nr:quinon protein alcohol dehydrogenase-like superfamily [Spinellus fusiger]